MYDDDSTVVRDREVVRENRPAYVDRRPAYLGPTPADYLSRLIKVLFGIIQALLILRIVFLLLIANRDNAVVQTVLGVTDWLVSPFVGMFRFDNVRTSSGSVLDVAAIVALIAWTIVEWIVLATVNVFRPNAPVDA